MSDLKDGTGDLQDGTKDFKKGTQDLVNGVDDLSDGTVKLKDGACTLSGGAKTLAAGSASVNSSITKLKNEGSSQIASGAAQLHSGSEALLAAYSFTDAQHPGMDYLSNALPLGVQQLGSSMSASFNSTAGDIDAIATMVNTVGNKIDSTVTVDVSGVAQLEQKCQTDRTNLGDPSTLSGDKLDTYNYLSGEIEAYDQAIAAMQQSRTNPQNAGATSTLSQCAAGLSQISTTMRTSAKGFENVTQTYSPLNSLYQGTVGVQQYTSQMKTGTTQLNDGLATLSSKTAEFDGYMGQLQAGSESLSNGASVLANGAATLADGTVSLNKGVADLKVGSVSLNDGAGDLSDGVGDLVDGVDKLANGSDDLHDGMVEFNEKGIQKLQKIFGNDVKDVLDRLDAVKDAGSAYTNFSGTADDSTAKVKFIFKTAEIK